jgi:hypothetical protein
MISPRHRVHEVSLTGVEEDDLASGVLSEEVVQSGRVVRNT